MKLSKILFWASGLVFLFGIAFGLMFPEHSWVAHPNSVGSSVTVSINTFGLITLALLAFGITSRQVERKTETNENR